jgi:hypothetical protein
VTSYATNGVSAGGSTDSIGLLVDNTASPHTFLAVGMIHDQPVNTVPSGLTLRNNASAGGYTWSFYTAALVPNSTFLNDFFFFDADVHATMIWLAFESDGGGTIYENLSAHAIDMDAASGGVAAELYPSVDGWPFVWSWVTGSGGFATDTVPYFEPLRTGDDRNDEWLTLHGPDVCAGYPTHWPFDWTLDTPRTFRRLSMIDLAAPSTSRPVGCTIPDPPTSGRFYEGRVGFRG